MTVRPISPLRRAAAGPFAGARDAGAGLLQRLRAALLPGLPVVHYDAQRRMLLLPERAGGALRRGEQPRRRHEPVELHFPAEAVLRKSIRLPAAARENLASVLAFEMDRETPFAAESVWFTYRVAARDRTSITIDLLVIPRALFEECRDALAARGMEARRIAVDAGGDAPPTRFPVRAGLSERRFMPAPGLLGLGLALALLVTALDIRHEAALSDRLAELQSRAEQAQSLRRSLELAGTETTADLPSRVALLAALADALPDGTWLDRLSIDGRTVELSGFAPDAAGLLVRLGQLPQFADVRFLGATVRDAKLQREHFQITLSVTDLVP